MVEKMGGGIDHENSYKFLLSGSRRVVDGRKNGRRRLLAI